MSNEYVPSFLGDQDVKLPVGGSFAPGGFIGNFKANHMFVFNPQDTDESVAVEAGVAPDLVDHMGRFCYLDYDAAKNAIKVLDVRDNFNADKPARPQHIWSAGSTVEEVLNLGSPEKWESGVVSSFCAVKSLQSITSKYFWNGFAFHLIVLPIAVAAFADLIGLDNAGFDISELLDPDATFTAALFTELCGDPEDHTYDRLNDAVLWQRRAALWASLGEDDPKKFNVYSGEGRVGKFDTADNNLARCLRIVQKTWDNPTWSKLVFVPNPRPDAVSGTSGNRLNLPGLVAFYRTREKAQAAADAEKEENGTDTSPTKKAIPEAYAEHEHMFHDELTKWKNENPTWDTMPPPALASALKGHLSFSSCDPAEVIAWL